MNDSVPSEPVPSEATGSVQYRKLIEARLGQPIAADISADAERIALSPGAKLAASRNAMGWSIEQVAFQLRLAPRQITSIEMDDYASLPEPAIVRGFIRAYAKLLKLDPGPLVALISMGPGAKKMKRSSPGSNSPDSPPGAQTSNTKNITLHFKLIVVAISISMLALTAFLIFG